MTNTPPPAAPPLILIVPQDALERMPAANAAGIRGCESQYHRGSYYITVPPEVYNQWSQAQREPTP